MAVFKVPLNTGGREVPTSYICDTAQKMKFSIRAFSSKCDQIHSFLRIWSHLLKKSLMEKFVFYAAHAISGSVG